MSITESSSQYSHLEKMSVAGLLENMNREDRKVPLAVGRAVPMIEKLVTAAWKKLKTGGRMFYIGAGTSGRLGVLDASEIPPTYGMEKGRVIGLIAGGDKALRNSVEHAEDDIHQAWKDLQKFQIGEKDFLIGIAASGTTPYVAGGLKDAQDHGIRTGCITCNPDSVVRKYADFPVEVIVGPEFVTGSTRMKSGTAQKLVLNMISTTLMIKLGRVRGNKMVDMQLTNTKLFKRGVRMIMEETGTDAEEATRLLKRYGSVRKAADAFRKPVRKRRK